MASQRRLISASGSGTLVVLEDGYGVLRHVAERGPEHGLEGSRLAVAGDSAGANTAAEVTLLA